MNYQIIQGDCLEVMKQFPDNHFTGICTDPPYGLHFMGKGWDYDVPCIEYWAGGLRILKPGGYLLAMGGTRKFHRLMCAIEEAGFEIRDTICWLYGSGFPKSHNISKSIDKANNAERPIVGRYIRPEGTQRPNAELTPHNWVSSGFANHNITENVTDLAKKMDGYGTALKPAWEPIIMAMKPCDGTFAENAEKWGVGGINIDACRIGSEEIKTNAKTKGESFTHLGNGEGFEGCPESTHKGRWPANLLLDEEVAEEMGPPSRYFYCAKTSSSERGEGNNHPTVKPLALMRYLITLISPPTNALILDPFAGSGSTIVAAAQLGIAAIGIEKQPEYAEIARARLFATIEKVKKAADQLKFIV